MNNKKIPFFIPKITKEDKRKMLEVFNSTILTNGPNTEKFEKAFGKYTNSKYATAVSNATSALHLSLEALGIGKNDEVIVPNMTFLATANAVLMAGATPILADVDIHDHNISIDSIKNNLTKKTKAIIPVHLAGKACKMNDIMKIAKKEKMFIIEDCAHAIGTKYKKQHVGTFGDAACFSFYPTKNITTLEGGMIISKSKKISEITKITRNHGMNRTLKQRYTSGYPWDYDIKKPGYNYRMDEIRAVLGLNQLKRIKKINSERQKSFKYYCQQLSKINGINLPDTNDLKDNACHLFRINIDKIEFGMNRNQVFTKLLEKNINTSVHYKPLSLFTIFKKKSKSYSTLKNSLKIYNETLSLPFYTGISKNDQNIVIDALKSIKN
jgi:dTDP-4-amino-4,6-dideoxygalactose transaminase|tara:strand:+ start:1023 stop:2168 length:1146 start_codon:yes stop_codon:yes gene_type:complete